MATLTTRSARGSLALTPRAIIQLGPHESHLEYVDIDTSHFSGNECPESQVFGLRLDAGIHAAGATLQDTDPRWEELLPVVTLGPNSRHIYELNQRAKEGVWSAVMVRMMPDGGMARFRAYGRPVPPPFVTSLPGPDAQPMNLLSPLIGGHIVNCSDANFSPPENLLRLGRGHDMSDGWETRRSQVGRGKYAPGAALAGQERKEWVVAKLGTTGVVQYVEIDTAYHPGNYPVAASVEATLSSEEEPAKDAVWTTLVPKSPLGSHRQHWLAVDRKVSPTAVFSHIRMCIYPDGGLKRLRIFGHPVDPKTKLTAPERITLRAMPLTYETFKAYGQVIQGWDLPSSAPKGIPVTTANQGTAAKFHRLADVAESYPEGMLKKGGVALACMRAGPQFDVRKGATIPITKLERHAATTQAFIPMGRGQAPGETPHKAGGTFVVLAALNGPDDRPDMSTLKAFLPTAAQGVSYNPGVWHHPMLTVNEWMDYCCVDAQTGDDNVVMDCETIPADFDVYVPPYDPPTPKDLPVTPAPTGASSAKTAIASLLPNGHRVIHPVPITHSAWAPYGELVRAYPNSPPPSTAVVGGNKALNITKLSWLSSLENKYPAEVDAKTAIGVYRATPKEGLVRGQTFDIRHMERHPYTSQAFVPMGKAEWVGMGESGLPPGGTFLVVVADNGPDDRPDPKTLKAFLMESGCALNYKAGVWREYSDATNRRLGAQIASKRGPPRPLAAS